MSSLRVFLCALVCTALFPYTSAQVVTPVAELDLNEFAGTWYEIEAGYIPKSTYEYGCYCTFAEYTWPGDDTSTVDILNECSRMLGPPRMTAVGNTPMIPEDGIIRPGVLNVDFSPILNDPAMMESLDMFGIIENIHNVPGQAYNYLVLWVDGDDDVPYRHMVVSAADPKMGLWIMSRDRLMSEEDLLRAKDNANLAGVPLELLRQPLLIPTEQENC